MATITLRSSKGSALTNAEIDANFSNLNTELGQKLVAGDLAPYLTSSAAASTYAPLSGVSGGVVSGAITFKDTRTVTDTPAQKLSQAFSADFKDASVVNFPPVIAGNGYAHILNTQGWVGGDFSGGAPSQLSIGDGIAVRQAVNGSTWGAWRTMLHDGNFGNYALPLSGGAMSNNAGIDFYNSTYGATLRVGGNGYNTLGKASVFTTNGNLHLDPSAADRGVYLNWYTGDGVHFGNGAGLEAGFFGTNGRFSLSGWSTTGRNYSHEWIEFPNATGLYSPINGAHFYPNDGVFGSWRVSGSRNGWHGLQFDSAVTLMVNGDNVGFYNLNAGWQMRWSGGAGFVSKGGIGGGTEAEILDSANYSNYALPRSGGALTGDLHFAPGSTGSYFPSHFFHHEYDSAGNVYEHYYAGSASENVKNSTANLRVASTVGYYKTLGFSGDGTFTWDGQSVFHTGNYQSYLNNSYVRAIGYASGSNDWNSLGNTFPNTVEQIHTDNFSAGHSGPPANYGYGTLLNFSSGVSSQAQFYISHLGTDLNFRGGWAGNSWQPWRTVLFDGNYNNYSPSLTGVGATGTWNINVTGNASGPDNQLYRGYVSADSLDSVTGNGSYTVGYAGSSSGLVVHNVSGSTGIVQTEYFYQGGLRFRSKTDSATWNPWKLVITDANIGTYGYQTAAQVDARVQQVAVGMELIAEIAPVHGVAALEIAVPAGVYKTLYVYINDLQQYEISTGNTVRAYIFTKIRSVNNFFESLSAIVGYSGSSGLIASAEIVIPLASITARKLIRVTNGQGSSGSGLGLGGNTTYQMPPVNLIRLETYPEYAFLQTGSFMVYGVK